MTNLSDDAHCVVRLPHPRRHALSIAGRGVEPMYGRDDSSEACSCRKDDDGTVVFNCPSDPDLLLPWANPLTAMGPVGEHPLS